MHRSPYVRDEPTHDELAAIELEMPLIEAEVDLVDAEIRLLTAEGGPSPLDWRRLRRAVGSPKATALREALTIAPTTDAAVHTATNTTAEPVPSAEPVRESPQAEPVGHPGAALPVPTDESPTAEARKPLAWPVLLLAARLRRHLGRLGGPGQAHRVRRGGPAARHR